MLFSVLLLLAAIAIGSMIVLWTVSDITGEYACTVPRLRMVRLSLMRRGEVLKGQLAYANQPPLELVASSSVRPEDINLTFEITSMFPGKGRYRRVKLLGKFENGSIVGVVVDSSIPYPVNLHRNVIYSVIKRLQCLSLRQ
jgi:hypothetical protein